MTLEEIDLSIFGELQGRWKISSAFLIADTPTSHIYRATQLDGTSVIIKALKENGLEEMRGADYLRAVNGHGAVELYDATADMLLLEDAGDMNLKDFWIIRGEEQATNRIVALIEKLHRCQKGPNSDALTPLKEHFKALLAPSVHVAGDVKDDLAYARSIATTLLEDDEDAIPLHGDLHHENILYHQTRGWLAIDPKGLVGNPIYDCVNIFGNPNDAPLEQVVSVPRTHYLASRFAALFRKEPSIILHYAIAHAGLALSWHLEDKSRIKENSDAAKRLAFIRLGRQMLSQGI